MVSVPKRRPKLTSRWLFEQLRDAIISGEYPAGEPIRQEELAIRFEVSRTPVREAIRLLEAEGLVEQWPHRGAVVAELDAEDALELFAVRAALEALAVRRSFPKLSGGQVRAIKDAHQALDKARPHEALARHRAFHLALYAAAGPRLQKMVRDQLDAAQRYHLRFGRPSMEVSDSDRRDHEALVEAAQARDAEAAIAIVQSHVGGGGVLIAASIAERTVPAD